MRKAHHTQKKILKVNDAAAYQCFWLAISGQNILTGIRDGFFSLQWGCKRLGV